MLAVLMKILKNFLATAMFPIKKIGGGQEMKKKLTYIFISEPPYRTLNT